MLHLCTHMKLLFWNCVCISVSFMIFICKHSKCICNVSWTFVVNMRQYGPFEIYLKAVLPLSWKMALLVLSDTNFWCNCLYKRKFHETKLSFLNLQDLSRCQSAGKIYKILQQWVVQNSAPIFTHCWPLSNSFWNHAAMHKPSSRTVGSSGRLTSRSKWMISDVNKLPMDCTCYIENSCMGLVPKTNRFSMAFRHILHVFDLQVLYNRILGASHDLCIRKRICLFVSSDATRHIGLASFVKMLSSRI